MVRMSKKYHIITYGCQMNLSDSERIASLLEQNGYELVSDKNKADLIVVNMCSIRQSAVDRVYGLIPAFERLKNKKIILTGCILKKDKKNLQEKFNTLVNIKDLPRLVTPNSKKSYLKINPKYSKGYSALIPIMTGCNNFCSYCAVPYTRGKEVSRPDKEILCEIRKSKAKEIWLLGENVNSYNYKDINFSELIKRIEKIPGNFWIRFVSPNPKNFSNKLIKTLANCRKYSQHLHLPLQSGDNEILKKMKRPYTVEKYIKIINNLKKEIPSINLSTDAIVGFPGETKKQFSNTKKIFERIKFDMAYISKYSPRPGTVASKIKDDVPREEKNRREKVLTEVLKKTSLENNKKYIGKILTILVDKMKKDSAFGKSKEYKNVKFKSKNNITGEFIKIKITKAKSFGLEGDIYEK